MACLLISDGIGKLWLPTFPRSWLPFLAQTRFAAAWPVRIWTQVFWLCLGFPLEAGMEPAWAGSWCMASA